MSKSKKKKKATIRLSGRNIYTDKQNRTIFYDGITKRGYLIEQADENKIVFFQNRLVIILFAAILAAGTILTWQQATVGGVIVFVLVEGYYRFRFFKNLTRVEGVDFGRRVSPVESIVNNKEREKVMILALLYCAFAVLILVNAYLEKYSLALSLLSVGLSIVGAYFCILHVIALTKMK